MKSKYYLTIRNEEAFKISDIPILPESEFRDTVIDKVREDERIVSFFGRTIDKNKVNLTIVLANDKNGLFSVLSMIAEDAYQSLTLICPQAHMFEREIFENFDIIPKGHPWLKPVRFRHFENTGNDNIKSVESEYFAVKGEGIHEVAVGPVHAGVIEPGHFRFQCNGETVFNLEIALGYQHRGIEKALIGGPDLKTLHFMETAAGDSTIAHTTAYCRINESLSEMKVPEKAEIVRAVALELERIANHVGDLGALAGDVAYLPTASFCGRLRGDVLNMTARLCGNRFGRNLLCPGGLKQDFSNKEAMSLLSAFMNRMEEIENAVELLWKTPSVLSRFENTGKINSSACGFLGIVGIPARACGLDIDARINFPSGIYCNFEMPMSKADSGDVYARAMIRWLDIQNSKKIIIDNLNLFRSGNVRVIKEKKQLLPEHGVVSIIEGWRGEIVHTALTNAEGKFAVYKMVDPSFHNWPALAMALRNEEISNFPLCNKSFNLSYCGHDLQEK